MAGVGVLAGDGQVRGFNSMPLPPEVTLPLRCGKSEYVIEKLNKVNCGLRGCDIV
jgi:hypothetical protein